MGCRKCEPVAPPHRWPAVVCTSDAQAQQCGHYNPGSRSGDLVVGWLIEWLHMRVKRAAMNASQAVLHGKGSADALVTMGERVQKVAWGGSIFPMVPGHLPAFAKDRMSISRVLVRQIGRTRGGWSEPSPGVLPNPDWVPADMIGHTTEEWVNLSMNGRAKNKPIVL